MAKKSSMTFVEDFAFYEQLWKAEAAEEMSVASGMKYVMYAGSVLMKQNVLEHPPVTYSEEPSPLLMVAEDPVPYGK